MIHHNRWWIAQEKHKYFVVDYIILLLIYFSASEKQNHPWRMRGKPNKSEVFYIFDLTYRHYGAGF
jgi:hypothetical protein